MSSIAYHWGSLPRSATYSAQSMVVVIASISVGRPDNTRRLPPTAQLREMQSFASLVVLCTLEFRAPLSVADGASVSIYTTNAAPTHRSSPQYPSSQKSFFSARHQPCKWMRNPSSISRSVPAPKSAHVVASTGVKSTAALYGANSFEDRELQQSAPARFVRSTAPPPQDRRLFQLPAGPVVVRAHHG